LHFLARTKQQSKKNSVVKASETLSSIRELAQGLEEILSPRKKEHPLGKGAFMFPQGIQQGSPVAEIYKRAKETVVLYKAKLAAGEILHLENFILMKALRMGEWGREYLVKDPYSEIRIVLKLISLDRLNIAFGIQFWKVQELLKIYMDISDFLPDLYKATVAGGYLMLYTQYFE
jgi:hypothetical protein